MASPADILGEVTYEDLDHLDLPDDASITDVKHLSSYNWLEMQTPTIAVPGCPPLWSPPPCSRMLNKDTGRVFIDQNAARLPETPLEPLFRAVYTTDPSFDMRPVNVVTDRNNLRKLIAFANPYLSPRGIEPFSFGVEVVGDTAMFARQEPKSVDHIKPNMFRGFGHEFENAYTTRQVPGSTGHHRIISYQFGGLNMVVRYEADGYVASDDELLSSMVDKMGSLSLTSLTRAAKSDANNAADGSKLTVVQHGRPVPPESIIEIKTRTYNKLLNIAEITPQLWAAQTPKLVRAYHYQGKFSNPQTEDVGTQVKAWETRNQKDLQTLAAVIRKITEVVKAAGARATVRYAGTDRLAITKDSDQEKMLPASLYSKWEADGPKADEKDDTTKYAAQPEAEPPVLTIPKDKGDFDDIIDETFDNGLRQIFHRLPASLADYRALCDSIESLGIDVTDGRDIRRIMDDLREGTDYYNVRERRRIKGRKDEAQDSAFRLVYVLLKGAEDSDSFRETAYNAAEFVVSHDRVFDKKTRVVVKEAFVQQFPVSKRQLASLDKWPTTTGGQ